MGVMVVATMFVGVGALTANAQQAVVSASDVQYAATVRSGSVGQSALIWQKFLNDYSSANLVADSKFGPLSGAALKIWQASRNLSADGVAGAMSRASAVAQINSGVTNPIGGNFPAGCSSASGYSVTTGAPCTGAMAYPAGCTSNAGYSVTTGQPCTGGANLPAGCSSTAGYSPTTGQLCASGGAVVSGSGVGLLSNITKLSSYNNTKVSEGMIDQPVFGVEVTAKDADQVIDSVKVSFYNAGTGSVKLQKYAGDVSIWLDGKEIGRKSVSAFSDDASDVYVYRFTGMNGVVKQNAKGQIIVAVSGANSIDSTDATNETWKVFAGATYNSGSPTDTDYLTAVSPSTRYDTYGVSGFISTVDFQKAGGVSSDQKYKVSASSTNPIANIVQVSSTSDTLNKTLLSFDVKAENGAMLVQKLPIDFTATIGPADGVTPNVEALVKTVYLYANGTQIASENVPTGTGVKNIIFGNTSKLQYHVAQDATVKFEVRADFNDTENTGLVASDFDDGDQIKADYTTTNVTNSTIELDNGNQDTVSNRSGSVAGEQQTLRSTGASVVMGNATTSYTGPAYSGDVSNKAIFNIPLTVTAFENTLYTGQSLQAAAAGAITGTNALSFTVNDSATPTTQDTTTATGGITTTISSSATVSGSAWILPAGQSRTFNVQVIITGATAAKNYRVQMNDLKFFTDAALSTGATIQNLVPMASFQSPFSPVF